MIRKPQQLHKASPTAVMRIGLLIGLLLNITGWLGNNLLLGDLWQEAAKSIPDSSWRDSPWRDLFSLAPDFLYGIAIAWLVNQLNAISAATTSNGIKAGLFVSLVGGITTYFAVANSGFVPWSLGVASILLVLLTKVPLALLAGRMLARDPKSRDS